MSPRGVRSSSSRTRRGSSRISFPEIKNIRYRGVTAKLDLALEKLPDVHRGVVHVGPSLDFLERAYDAAKYGNASEEPFLRAVVPSLVDPSVAPEASRERHVMSILIQYIPVGTSISPQKVIDTLELDGSVLHYKLQTPSDYERELGLPGWKPSPRRDGLGSDVFHATRSWMGALRNARRRTLFRGGRARTRAAASPAAPGRNAAQVLLKHRG